jgi:arylsulfatase A-like enzyme
MERLRRRPGARSRARLRALAGLSIASSLLGGLACGGRPERPGGVVLFVIDTLRADRLSCYGNPRPTSPEIDRLAARGVLFERAVTGATWTLPSFVAILSGRIPTQADFARTLERSLVERLEEAGFATAAFTEGGFASREFRLDRGFDYWWEEYGIAPGAKAARGGEPVANAASHPGIELTFASAERWLREHAAERFFLLVHTYEVHTPYRRRDFAADLDRGVLGPTFEIADTARIRRGELSLGPTELAYVEALYDGGVAAADRHVGQLLRVLAEVGRADDTLVVLTSDHGEDLGRRSPARPGTHGHSLYDDELRVPLVLYDPTDRVPARRIATLVRTVDVLPTVLDRVGVPIPADLDGRSLVPILRGEETTHRTAYSEIPRSRFVRKASLLEYPHKLIVNVPPREAEEPAFELYDLEADPAEASDRTALDPERAERMRAELESRRAARDRDGRADFDRPTQNEALTERLRALGYVE